MSSNTNVKEIEIDIPIEKVNDLKFIQEYFSNFAGKRPELS